MSGPRRPAGRASSAPSKKTELHSRNRHRGQYDFAALIQTEPALAGFVANNRYGNPSIDFADPAAVRCLNRALLRQCYAVRDWDIPPSYLCPPIPGRADYLHYLADLLATDAGGEVPRGQRIRALDIGTGANLVYPLIGQHEYGWQFVGADIDAVALRNAAAILAANPAAQAAITLRQQANAEQIFSGVIHADERFELSLCNPPFHRSLAEAHAGSERKWRGLAASAGEPEPRGNRRDSKKPTAGGDKNRDQPLRNFGGQGAELVCPGGEAGFITRMINESVAFRDQVLWFTSLVSQADNLPAVQRALKQAAVATSVTVAMAQGQKQSRFVAWSFQSPAQRQQWLRER